MSGKLRAYFELLRFPAVFTAIADVMMGYLVTRGSLHPEAAFGVLALISALLYLAGMVLNDVFDVAIDTAERPDRPIPSGRISRRAAAILGWSLLIAGIILAHHISSHCDTTRIAKIGVALAACVVLYDAFLKRTFAGPLAMGLCRMLNVLLGMSLAAAPNGNTLRPWTSTELAIAAGVGIYITGVSHFARSEVNPENRRRFLWGMLVMSLGLLTLEVSGRLQLRPATFMTEQPTWPLMWLGLATVILGRCLWAVWRLEPGAVQVAVRNSLRAIIVIDAAIVLGFCGPSWGGVVLALLAPMLLLERWASTT